MFTAAMFDDRSVRSFPLHLRGGEFIQREAYPFPDHKLLILARSESDGRTGKPVLHNRSLKERTNGQTEHMEVANGYRLRSLLEHILDNGVEEERTLQMRIEELQMAAKFLLRRGRMRDGDYREIFTLLRDIGRSLDAPKRNPEKLQAARDVATATNYRSPKGKNPVGPVSAMAANGAVKRIERRLAQMVGIRSFVSVRHLLVCEYLRYAAWQFRLLARFKGYHDIIVEKPARGSEPPKTVTIFQMMKRLESLRMQPFATPSDRILKAHEAFRYADTVSEADFMRIVREEAHLVMLIETIENKLLVPLSKSLHSASSLEKLNKQVSDILETHSIIELHLGRCENFSKSVQKYALTRIVRSREKLAQEELSFEGEQEAKEPKEQRQAIRKRLKKADRTLKVLTAVLPI